VGTIYFWIEFHVLIAILLIADLGIFHRKKRLPSFKEACWHSVFWIVLALLFNTIIYYVFGSESAIQFLTGYLIEKSLSIDNLFYFSILFLHFRVPEFHQYKILYWGILGALLFRISLILTGVVLISRFHWIFYLLGVFLIATGIKFLIQRQKEKNDPSTSQTFRFLKKIFPIEEGDVSGKFFVKKRGKWKVTTLFLVLLLIECTDIVFALDSIPAIFAITTEPFIVYTSNIFAILGLRSLYFVIASSLGKLRYYQFGLAAILVFIGFKMLLADVAPISVPISLAVILVILGVTAAVSLRRSKV
jgi:tellurite resistance protein TerC